MNEPQLLYFGIYVCQRCSKRYTVEDGTWRHCTPEFCHDCLEHLNKRWHKFSRALKATE